MFGILMERECETIRRKWNKKFAAHAVGIEGVANIHAYTIFGQWWQERRDEECAWRGQEKGEYKDLIIFDENGEGE